MHNSRKELNLHPQIRRFSDYLSESNDNRTRQHPVDLLAKDSGLWYLDESLFERSDYYEDFVLDFKYEFDRSTEPITKLYIAEHSNYCHSANTRSNLLISKLLCVVAEWWQVAAK